MNYHNHRKRRYRNTLAPSPIFSSTNVRTIMHKVAKAATLPRNVAKPSYLWVSWALFMDKIPIFIARMRLSFSFF